MTALTHAGEAQPVAANPALEKHVMAIAEELRCLVCQNQTIADSSAPLAVDLKNQVREKLEQGMSDKDILDYMVQRYGDFVLYRPPVKVTTWLLWFGPFLLLIGGIVFLGLKLRRGRPHVDALPQAQMQRASDLLRATPEMKETQ
nr:cytochrome c-type biogenesis protein CcmH [Rhodoferax sp.]